jgi:succinate dehydrogenase / fumarate reductase, cytochrome b subunit
MHQKRPKHLNLMQIRLPLPGVLSILHRVSGFGMFLMLPVMLYLLQLSLASPETFAACQAVLVHPVTKIFLLGMVWAYAHHFCAGIRYLLLDLHWFVDLAGARASAMVSFVVSLVITALVGGFVLW